MTRAVLSLGSNLGDPIQQLAAAVELLGDAVIARSSLYSTPPWGPVEQDDFVNQTVIVDDPSVDAMGWLRRCQQAEQAAHRQRLVHWGPRTLDADVIAVWDDGVPVLSDDPELTLPHPHAGVRAFVLLPWAELEPEAALPGVGDVANLLAALDVSDIRRVSPVDDDRVAGG